jgi:hypothetical protein
MAVLALPIIERVPHRERSCFNRPSRTGIADDIVSDAAAYLNGERSGCMRRNWVLRLVQNAQSFFERA